MDDPSTIGAIEVYSSSERPAEFGPGLQEGTPPIPGAPAPTVDIRPQCGLVVIWTVARLGLREAPAVARPNAVAGSALMSDAVGADVTQGVATFANESQCKAPHPIDTTDLAIYALIQGLPPRPMPDTAWSGYKDRVLTALDQSAAFPSDLVLPAFGVPFARGAGLDAAISGRRQGLAVAPTLSNVIEFTLDEHGALLEAYVAASSLSPSADTTVLAMVERAAASHAFPRLPATDPASDSAHLYLAVASIQPRVGLRAAVLGELEVPVWHLSRNAHPVAGPGAQDLLKGVQDSATADSVTAEMIVDAAGRPIRSTMRIIAAPAASGSGPPADSTRSISDRLATTQFEPALIGTCAVPQLVLQSFATSNNGRARH